VVWKTWRSSPFWVTENSAYLRNHCSPVSGLRFKSHRRYPGCFNCEYGSIGPVAFVTKPKFRGLCSSAGAIEGRGHRAQRRWQARSCSAIWRADAPCLQVIPLDPAKSQPNEAIAGCRADRTRELPPSLWHLRFDYRTKDSVVNSWHLSPVALRVRSMRGGLARDLTV